MAGHLVQPLCQILHLLLQGCCLDCLCLGLGRGFLKPAPEMGRQGNDILDPFTIFGLSLIQLLLLGRQFRLKLREPCLQGVVLLPRLLWRCRRSGVAVGRPS